MVYLLTGYVLTGRPVDLATGELADWRKGTTVQSLSRDIARERASRKIHAFAMRPRRRGARKNA